jgi:hypothetical protein
VDLSRPGSARRMVADAIEYLSEIDVLVNNAGGYSAPTYPMNDHWRSPLEPLCSLRRLTGRRARFRGPLIFVKPIPLSSASPGRRSEVLPVVFLVEFPPTCGSCFAHLDTSLSSLNRHPRKP